MGRIRRMGKVLFLVHSSGEGTSRNYFPVPIVGKLLFTWFSDFATLPPLFTTPSSSAYCHELPITKNWLELPCFLEGRIGGGGMHRAGRLRENQRFARRWLPRQLDGRSRPSIATGSQEAPRVLELQQQSSADRGRFPGSLTRTFSLSCRI